ncbi:MAG: hypothetical protein AAFX06_23295 [Planctomycetota bacterium]
MFRRALISRRLRESIAWCSVTFLLGFWLLFVSDRVFATPVAARVLLATGLGGAVLVAAFRVLSLCLKTTGRLRLARMIRQRDMVFGDHLVGALELAQSQTEQARSRALCEAALGQVADEIERRDLSRALPPSLSRLGTQLAFGLVVPILAASFFVPDAMSATFRRLVTPTVLVERHTFARIVALPAHRVVPHDEARRFAVSIDPNSRWKPSTATMSIAGARLVAALKEESYWFEVPPLIENTPASVRVGDAVATLEFVPQLRPEWQSVVADVDLPEYLDSHATRETLEVDVRSGALEVVEGSRVAIRGTSTNELSYVSVNNRPAAIEGREMSSALRQSTGNVVVNCVDSDGLGGAKPFLLELTSRPDRKPSLIVESDGLPSMVLLDQQLRFKLLAEDDFGVAKVGMEWILGDNRSFGGRVLGGGGVAELPLEAFFQASALSVSPGELSLRFWAIDKFPDRDRVYTDPILINLVSQSEHAVWVRDEFDRWRQSAMDVRDRELSLFQRNRELARVDRKQRGQAWRDQLAEQARAEAQNGKRLEQLTRRGEDLLRQASRNSDVESDYIETLAQTIQNLQGLSKNRMPRVAELLKRASEQESDFEELADAESTQADVAAMAERPSGSSSDDKDSEQRERVGLAGTTILDSSGRGDDGSATEDADETDELLDAIDDQEALVAAFDAIADQMQQLLGRMEGSTLVKRLKAISRIQDRVAGELARNLEKTFGQSPATNATLLTEAERMIVESADKARTAVDDLEAFLKRREIEHFGHVLREIKGADLLNQLVTMRKNLVVHPGASIAEAEYWADNLDRWADDLVHPGKKQHNEGRKNLKSLPPSVILEVLRVLESEVNLREQTRMAERGRELMERQDYMAEAIRLSESQDFIRDRLDQIVDEIDSAPDAALHFAAEMEVLSLASSAMVDATKTLVSPETGPDAIAAQTEAIELLLRSKKVTPEGGEASSGGQAGGSAGGDTQEAAAALLGRGFDALAQERDSKTKFAVGRNRNEVPEHWLEGVQQYHLRLEQRRAEEQE